MTSLLRVEEAIPSVDDCTQLIKFIAGTLQDDCPWKCKHIHFLVAKSELPGSGLAATLHCDLSGITWINLLLKHDLNLETVQAIASLKGIVTPQDVVRYVRDNGNVTILQYTLENSKLDDSSLIKLCEQAIKLKKINFSKELMNYSLSIGDPSKLFEVALKLNSIDFVEKLVTSQDTNIDPTVIVSKMSKTDIQSRKKLTSFIMSTPEGCVQLLLKAIEYSEFEVAEDCLHADSDSIKCNLDLGSILKSHQGSKDEKQLRIAFIEKLLKSGMDPNGQTGKMCPLDVVLSLSKEYQCEKEKLVMLLLQNGASIEQCTYQREKGTTLVHEATKFAIDSSKISN